MYLLIRKYPVHFHIFWFGTSNLYHNSLVFVAFFRIWSFFSYLRWNKCFLDIWMISGSNKKSIRPFEWLNCLFTLFVSIYMMSEITKVFQVFVSVKLQRRIYCSMKVEFRTKKPYLLFFLTGYIHFRVSHISRMLVNHKNPFTTQQSGNMPM